MASLTNVKVSYATEAGTGTYKEYVKAANPYRIPISGFEMIVYTDLRSSAAFTSEVMSSAPVSTTVTVAASGDTLQIPNDYASRLFGMMPFEYSVANSAAKNGQSAPSAEISGTTITRGTIRNIAVTT